jgi:hypothetical protein
MLEKAVVETQQQRGNPAPPDAGKSGNRDPATMEET